MNKSLSQNNKVPTIRFDGFEKCWREGVLGDFLVEHKIRNGDDAVTEVFSVAKYKGVINQLEHLGRVYASEDISNYKVAFSNDVIYTKSPTAEFPFGIIKQNQTNRTGVVSVLYAVFRPINKEVGNLIHLYFLSPKRTYNYLNPLVKKGAKNTINISNTDFLNGAKIYIPESVSEQQKITLFFSSVDNWIDNLKYQKLRIEEYKRGITQKIFTQEVRFKDNDGKSFSKWQRLPLGDIFERVTDKNKVNNKNVLTISAQKGLVNQENFFTKSVSAKNLTGYYLLRKGDFAYNKSYSKGHPIGAIKRLNLYDAGVVSTLYICFRIKDNQSSDFFEQYFNAGAANHAISKIVQEGARNHGLLNLSVSDFFESVYLDVPSVAEQKKIAEFLYSVDNLIEAKTKQVELAETWKKGLLQKMFV